VINLLALDAHIKLQNLLQEVNMRDQINDARDTFSCNKKHNVGISCYD